MLEVLNRSLRVKCEVRRKSDAFPSSCFARQKNATSHAQQGLESSLLFISKAFNGIQFRSCSRRVIAEDNANGRLTKEHPPAIQVWLPSIAEGDDTNKRSNTYRYADNGENTPEPVRREGCERLAKQRPEVHAGNSRECLNLDSAVSDFACAVRRYHLGQLAPWPFPQPR